MYGCLQRGKLCLCLLKIFPFNGDCQVLLLLDSLPALPYLILNNVIIYFAEVVVPIIFIRKQNLTSEIAHVLILVIYGNLVITLQRIKEFTVPQKNVALFLCTGR